LLASMVVLPRSRTFLPIPCVDLAPITLTSIALPDLILPYLLKILLARSPTWSRPDMFVILASLRSGPKHSGVHRRCIPLPTYRSSTHCSRATSRQIFFPHVASLALVSQHMASCHTVFLADIGQKSTQVRPMISPVSALASAEPTSITTSPL